MELIGKDYVDLKIDTDRMSGGKELASKLRKQTRGGIPWMVILDSAGKPLITSDGEKGNVGCPAQPHEVAHFNHMMRQTRQHMSDADLATLAVDLEVFAQRFRRPR